MPPPRNVNQLSRRLTNAKAIVRTGIAISPLYADYQVRTAIEAIRNGRPDETLDVDLLHKPTAPTIAAAIRKAEQQQRFR